MRIQIDQSGRLEQLNTKTVIAGSNSESQSLTLLVKTKQQLKRRLQKTLVPARDLPAVLFGVVIFILLQEFKQRPTAVDIDEEYSGKSDMIEETILKLYSQLHERVPVMRFIRIGKHANAHRVAWKTHRQKRVSNSKVVPEKEILKLWQQKSRP